jgi:hypothetical protein
MSSRRWTGSITGRVSTHAQVVVLVVAVAGGRRGVGVRPGRVLAAGPLDEHPDGEREDDQADPGLGPALEPAGQLGLQRDERQPGGQQRRRVPEPLLAAAIAARP